ncbi:MAG TPA: AMP-binding protein [Candidatus Baltobacteraceae bacterium]|nr:AMP-binding protein [Candidatus Baltobacteraceae bacterium]
MEGAHVDRFAEDHLPPPDAMPDLRFDLAGLHYPQRMNAVSYLLDRHIEDGRGERRCIVAPGAIDWSYGDLHRAVNKIANVLVRDLGVVPGARVLLRAPNSPMLAACWLAVLKAGAIAVATMPLYRSSELRYIIEKARIGLALCDARLGEELKSACERNPSIRLIWFNSDAPDAVEALMDGAHEDFETVPTAADETALIAFTSGTTGVPKAAMHFHRDLIATCDTYGKHVLRARPDDLFTGSPPLAFTYGLGGLLLFPLYAGAATLLLEQANPEQLLHAVGEFGVTTVFTAPIAYRTMCPMLERFDVSSLHTCVSAGETLPKIVFDEWLERTKVPILDGIGSTEMLHIFIGSPREKVRSGSTGRVVAGYLAQIHDDEGHPLPIGEVGRLAVKGPTGCKYLDDERQRAYVQNGWNYPGDAYRIDEDGYFYYVARTDDMIVSAGYNISGPEVEQALLAHAHVREAAVVSKPDPVHGTNIVKAYVVVVAAEHRHARKADELREHVKALIAPFKAPREIEFVDELPRTHTGKVQRYKLRERASSE